MRSIRLTQTRAEKSRDTQADLSVAPPTGHGWTWSRKTNAQWAGDCTTLDQLLIEEIARRVAARNAAILYQSDVDRVRRITGHVKALGTIHFSNLPETQATFLNLKTHARSRVGIWDQGQKAYRTWVGADAGWVLDDPDGTSTAMFGSLLASLLARKEAHSGLDNDWRKASCKLMGKARALDADNIAWYTAATRKFPAGTEAGDFIRSAIPTTTRAQAPVGQAEIKNLMVSGTDIHFDYDAPHGTRFTVLYQAPDSPALLVMLAETTEKSLTLHNAAAGLHRFQVEPMNSRGNGTPSVVVEATVAAEAVA